jgi:hypothetical protein
MQSIRRTLVAMAVLALAVSAAAAPLKFSNNSRFPTTLTINDVNMKPLKTIPLGGGGSATYDATPNTVYYVAFSGNAGGSGLFAVYNATSATLNMGAVTVQGPGPDAPKGCYAGTVVQLQSGLGLASHGEVYVLAGAFGTPKPGSIICVCTPPASNIPTIFVNSMCPPK